MNELCLVKMIQKSTTKLAVFFIVIAGMMVFLVPGLIEEADARTTATAISHVGPFSDVEGQLFAGSFNLNPIRVGSTIHWETNGISSNLNEIGIISAKVDGFDVYFVFNNPNQGPNSCQAAVSPSGPIHATCRITQGNFATAVYQVSSRG
jgi:hypothetical protein